MFGYLDTAIDLSQRTMNEVNRNLLFLDKAIYERNFVGLMPGIHWLPAAGVDVGMGDGGSRPRDFFELQLNVQLPVKWTAAGPGLRREVSRNDQYVEYQFAPPTAIPQVALMAAPFVAYATEIEGINFELLLHPNHDSIIDAMAVI